MGMKIYKSAGTVKITVVCDGDHGFFGTPKKTFSNMTLKHLFLIDMPFQAGWGTTNRDGERLWLCPACRGRSASQKTPVCRD